MSSFCKRVKTKVKIILYTSLLDSLILRFSLKCTRRDNRIIVLKLKSLSYNSFSYSSGSHAASLAVTDTSPYIHRAISSRFGGSPYSQ